MNVKVSNANTPVWKTVTVKSHIPEPLKKLDELAHNLWWAWNNEATALFSSLDKDLWRKVDKNPIELLTHISYKRLKEIASDEEFLARMDKVYTSFRQYMDVKPDAKRPSVAYLCMEYGINHVLKIYSGGLGILAGDYLKEASDSNVDMCAVGFLYRYGYFTQSLSMDGQQIANYDTQDFDRLPIERVLDENGNQVIVDVPFPNYQVHAAVWRANVGRISLYLLDTDNDLNSQYDRNITHSLYGGDWENRLKQEYLLGIGGILALKKLGITKDVYHCNEGHAALCNVQRLVDYVESGLNFDEALELVRASSLYTVHTPVPAGHDYFDEGLFGKYMGSFPGRLGISWDDFMGLGRTNPSDHGEKFCMSTFLCKTCQEVNGVSWLHGKVSQQMFKGIWPGYLPDENRPDHEFRTHDEWYDLYQDHSEESHVGYVTNGVHLPTWTAKEWKEVYGKYFDKNFLNDQSNASIWEKIYDVPDDVVWKTRMKLKVKLIDYIRERFRDNWLKNQGLGVHISEGEYQTVLGLIGDTARVDMDLIESLSIVDSVKRVTEPFKCCNRKFHPDDMIVQVGDVKVGGGNFCMIAGPCSVESEEQIVAVAKAVKASGANMLRGGAFKPRTSPYDFQGLKAEGIELLKIARQETGLPIVTEIMGTNYLPLFEDVDVIQVGARNMQNFDLLRELGKLRKPILLKRGLASTLKELLMSAEYIMAGGNEQVILCERGIRTYDDYMRNTLDLAAVPMLKELTHLPVIVDPSHATGIARLVRPMALAAAACGSDGLIIEVHNDPIHALCDGAQSLRPEQYDDLAKAVRRVREAVAE